MNIKGQIHIYINTYIYIYQQERYNNTNERLMENYKNELNEWARMDGDQDFIQGYIEDE